MAAAVSSSSKAVDDDIAIEEIVFSCVICQATVSEVYATTESNKGFHSGSSDEDGIVTKMWITECSHITCAKHLENGAAPFHPKGMAPRAPCPKCSKEKGDESPKELYGIRGLGDGEYDPVIPSEWRQCPAIKLDSSIPGISAIRFQYMALCHYSRQVRKHWMTVRQKQSAIEAAYSKERKQCCQLQSEMKQVMTRVEKLEQAEARLKKWEDRKPVITHYMNVVGKMAKDNEDMRHRLSELGVVLPKADYAFAHAKGATKDVSKVSGSEKHQGHRMADRRSSTIRDDNEESSSTRKRKREESVPDVLDQTDLFRKAHRRSSRELMPPPLPKGGSQQFGNSDLPVSHAAERVQHSFVQPVHSHIQQDGDWISWKSIPAGAHSEFEESRSRAGDGAHIPRSLPYRTSGAAYSRAANDVHEPTNSSANGYIADTQFVQASTRSDLQSSSHLYHLHEPRQSPSYRGAPRMEHSSDRPQGSQDGSWTSPGLMTRQGYHHPLMERPVLHPLGESHSNGQATPSMGQRPKVYAPSGTTAPVSSPFFRKERLHFRPPSMQQSPTGTSFVGSHNAVFVHPSLASHLTRPTLHPDVHISGQFRPQHAIYAENANRFNHPQPHDSPSFFVDKSTQHQRRPAISNTPQGYLTLSQRPSRPPPSASYSIHRPYSKTLPSRIPLQSTNGRSTLLAMEQDKTLSMLPGVRGVSSRGVLNYQRPAPIYDNPKDLFSSAGGRRSVRR